jgi:hypothetical protein
MRRRWARALAVVATLAAVPACGGGDDASGGSAGASSSTSTGVAGGGPIEVRTSGEPLGAVDATDTSCRFDGDRQLLAKGIVRNAGDKAYHVAITVRFLDAEGVRVELANDSVSDLQRGESARWDASTYSEDARSVTSCELSTQSS